MGGATGRGVVQISNGLLVSVTLFALLSWQAQAAIHTYKNELFYTVGNSFIYRGGREGMFASKGEVNNTLEALFKADPGSDKGKSEVILSKLEFHRPKYVAGQFSFDEGYTGLVQVVLFDVRDRDLIGYPTPEGRMYCCSSEDLVKKTKCFRDRLIYQTRDDGAWPKVVDVWFENDDTVAYNWEKPIVIEETGMYHLWFVVCNQEHGAVTSGGYTVWKNPNGFLPGMQYPFLKFYGYMSLLFLVLGIVWTVLYSKYWKELFTTQHYISAVIALGMMEMCTWYFDYNNFNQKGFRPVGITILAVLLGCLRKTFSRVLVLVVSMGYGVVKPTLGPAKAKVVALGTAYFIAVCALDFIANVGAVDDLTSTARLLLVLPVAVLDAVFIVWIFSALSKTLSQLTIRKQLVKLDLYRKFTNTLAVCVWLSVAWIVYEMYRHLTDQYKEHWQTEWVINAFWHQLNFVFLVVVCVLWAPSVGAMRYSYSAAVDDEVELMEDGTTSETAQVLKFEQELGTTGKRD